VRFAALRAFHTFFFFVNGKLTAGELTADLSSATLWSCHFQRWQPIFIRFHDSYLFGFNPY
ncbi:MAG: hypothetical protein ACREDR_45110, partial [Blastocatellia bacterium]